MDRRGDIAIRARPVPLFEIPESAPLSVTTMMPTGATTACDLERLRLLLSDQLPDRMQAEAADHVAECVQCRRTLETIAGDADWWTEVECILRTHAAVVDNVGSGAGVHGERPESHEYFSSDFVVDFLEPCDEPDTLGHLGEYEIVAMIGRGGMGVVLKGFQRELGRYVAVKVMAPHLAASGTARQRFVREARAAAAIVHPHVMPIHSVCTTSSLPYLVMPFVACESLQERIDRRGQLEIIEILRISLQTAQGLAASHAQGLVHRDVKPANILLETGVDRVLLTDFGLAKAVDDATVTRSGIVAGTPQYMSPEQSRGEPVDARSDLFSLGSVMYAMAAGRPPFRAETSVAVLRMISDYQACSLREFNPNVPDWLQLIVAHLHEKFAGQRFQSAAEVARLLEQCLAHVQQPTVNRLPVDLLPASKSADSSDSICQQQSPLSAPSRRMMGGSVFISALVVILICGLFRSRQVDRNQTHVRGEGASAPIPADPGAVRREPLPLPDPAPFGRDDLPVAVSWNFQGERPNFLMGWGTQRPGCIEPVADGLKLSRRADADESEFAVGFEVVGDLHQNFEITLDYRDFKSQAVCTDWRVPRIDISGQVFAQDDSVRPAHVLGIAHRRAVDSRQTVTGMQGDKGPDGTLVWRASEVPVARNSGRLRLTRQQNLMFYQAAPFGSEAWSTISCRRIDTGVFKLVVLGLRAEDLQGSGEVVLTNLTIRAAEIQLQ